MAENFIGSFGGMREIARKTPELSHAERAVFENIMSYANAQTGRCFPSVTRIANETSVSRYWAGRCLARLEELGHIRRMRRANGRGWEYEICSPLATSQSEAHPAETTEVAETAESVVAPEESRRAKPLRPASRQDPTAQTLARVLEALDALTRRVEAMERTLARMAERPGVPAEAPKPAAPAEPVAPAAPAPKSAKGKADRPEQLLLLPGGGNITETEQKPAWDIEDGWRRFWDAYPRHTDEKEGHRNFVKEFNRRADPEARLQKLLLLVEQMKGTGQWTRNDGQFIWVAKNFLTKWEKVAEEYAAGMFPPAGSSKSSSRHGQKLPMSDDEIKAYEARMEGRAPEDEGEGDSGTDGASEDDLSGLSEEELDILRRMEGRA